MARNLASRFLLISCFLSGLLAGIMAISASAKAQNGPQSYSVAQAGKAGSCKATFDVCAARCKTRLPDDKNCTSDHCSPKLIECRSTGCWQEGKLYGGALTCGLSK
jgi:hypothetical protein